MRKRSSVLPDELRIRLFTGYCLALLEIVDSGGVVRYRDDFPYAAEAGGFCPASVKVISGSNGAGFLLDMACAASEPNSGGPWQLLSVINGKISPLGKPFSAAGQMGDFVPGKINKIGTLTQALPWLFVWAGGKADSLWHSIVSIKRVTGLRQTGAKCL